MENYKNKEMNTKKCPECGKEELSYRAFSIDEDCYVVCKNCGFTLETSVPWGDIESEEEHDKLCKEALVELLRNYKK